MVRGSWGRAWAVLLPLALLWSACAPTPAPAPRPAGGGETAASSVVESPRQAAVGPTSNRTLTIVNTNEPVSLNARPLSET
jgi:hypothetical protein